ncbi:hypothetical protein SC09_Contig24orf00052 [Bacillus subtilis]|uniref:Uncharacterized protein n=1 Tax=Bacillus subtilis TaxID=1423 RepID=A0A0D1IPC5_BACIU|nr:hypothetical protein SC09_Contig24orf00052 [Bacillus subtilis]
MLLNKHVNRQLKHIQWVDTMRMSLKIKSRYSNTQPIINAFIEWVDYMSEQL